MRKVPSISGYGSLLYTSCEMEYIAKIDIECCMNTQQLSTTIYVVSHAAPRLDKYRSSIYRTCDRDLARYLYSI